MADSLPRISRPHPGTLQASPSNERTTEMEYRLLTRRGPQRGEQREKRQGAEQQTEESAGVHGGGLGQAKRREEVGGTGPPAKGKRRGKLGAGRISLSCSSSSLVVPPSGGS